MNIFGGPLPKQVQFSSVQFSCSVVSESLRPLGSQHTRPPCPSPTPGVHPNSCACSSHLIFCRPLLLLPPIPLSIRVFSNESTLRIRWPKYWSFSLSIIPSNEHPGLISFRMDWLDLLAVQGTLKSLLQHHSSKASILWHSAFFTVRLSHLYMTTGKTIALTRRTFKSMQKCSLEELRAKALLTTRTRSPRSVPWVAVLNIKDSDKCISCFLGDNGKLEQGRGKVSIYLNIHFDKKVRLPRIHMVISFK